MSSIARPIVSLFFVCVSVVAAPTFAIGQEKPGQEPPHITRASVERAVQGSSAPPQRTPPPDWSRVRALRAGAEIIITTSRAQPRHRHVVRTDDEGLVVVANKNDAEERIARVDVTEILRPRHGSIPLTILGASGGFVLGLFTAVSVGERNCGSSCADEKFLIGTALIGCPVGLGYLSYRAPRPPERIYRASPPRAPMR